MVNFLFLPSYTHSLTHSQEREKKEKFAEASRKKELKKAELAQKYDCYFWDGVPITMGIGCGLFGMGVV